MSNPETPSLRQMIAAAEAERTRALAEYFAASETLKRAEEKVKLATTRIQTLSQAKDAPVDADQ